MKTARIAFIAALSAALGCTVLSAGCGGTPVKASLGETVDDSVITAKVKAAFVNDAQVSALDITVETFKGTVQLSGFVNSSEEKLRARELAQGIHGVKTVKDDIRLKGVG